MVQRSERGNRRKTDIKGPLVISAVLGLVAFVVVSIVAAGGTDNPARFGLGLIAGGIAFIASVIVCSTLMLLERPNDPALGQGTGVNRSSAKLYAESKARRERERAQGGGAAASSSGGSSSGHGGTGSAHGTGRAADEGPQYGQRVRPDTEGEKPGS